MSGLLLQTKLFKPAPRPSLIARPQLIDRLNDGLGLGREGFAARLTLVSAPAGFGKTTLVAAWLEQLAQRSQAGPDVAWLSLDEDDNDLFRFLTYLLAALQTAVPALGERALHLLRSGQQPPAETILTLLLNEIGQKERPVVLVLDDYHMIRLPAIHQAVTFLLEHLPPRLHLLITTRSDPPLPLSRLRARRELVEVRAEELRFSPDEAHRFFDEVMGLRLSGEELAALEERTEGWIAGLQLAALSMREHRNVRHFISSFTGSNRLIVDYLTDEVLERRPQGTQSFLLQTSILDRLCGPLCDAVTGGNQGQLLLEQLENANFFLVPLDSDRRWYRYHHLFAEVLRNRLQQADSSMRQLLPPSSALHLRASDWFEQEGLIDEAIRHALAAPEVERATALIEHHSVLMFQRSEIFTSRAWLERLPAELVETRPRLILAKGWALVLTGHGSGLEEWLLTPPTSAAFAAPEVAPDVLGELALIRATQARYQHEHGRSLALALEARDLLSADNRGLLAGALYTIAASYLHQGDAAAASQMFAESVVAGETRGGPYMALAALQEMAELCLRQGRLSQTLEICRQATRMAARRGWESMPAAGMAQIYRGHVCYLRDDLDRASRELAEGINRLRGSTDQDVLASAYVTLGQVAMARGEYERALATIRSGEDWLSQMDVGDRGARTLLQLGEIRLWLRLGRLNEAERWLEDQHLAAEETDIGYLQRLALIRLRLAQQGLDPGQKLAEVSEKLGQLLHLKQNGGWSGQLIELLALQALLYQAEGDLDSALTSLERALALAEPEGYVRLFVDDGPPMAALLREARQRGLFADYAGRLLAAAGDPERTEQVGGLLPEPLSERELDVLRLLATGASNKDIAEHLVIALSTVKKHMGHILVKLDATNRVQALARAREFGLIS